MDKNKKAQSYMVFLLLTAILQCQVLGSYYPGPEYMPAGTKQAGFMYGEEDNKDSRENQKIKEAQRMTQQGRTAVKSRQQQNNDMMYTSLVYGLNCPDIEEAGRDTAASFLGVSKEVAGQRGPPYTYVT